MKKKQRQTIQGKTTTELLKLVEKERAEIRMRLLKQSEEKNTNIIKHMKHSIARMLTLIRENQLREDIMASTAQKNPGERRTKAKTQ